MIRMSKKFRNIVSVTTAVLVASTAIGYSMLGNNEKTVKADNTQTKEIVEKTINEQVHFTSVGYDKEETVFFISDANGNVKKTIVSDWLKNKENSDTIIDQSDLKNIENVKTDAGYDKQADGTMIWKAEGDDIFYQGETDKEAPVDVKVTYLLDGKEMSPKDIAGKSGKVTIRLEYNNHEKREVTVDGKKWDMYVPFTMISGMVLDSEKFSNVQVDSGKVICDGRRFIVVGLAFPGMNENLDLTEVSKKLEKDFSFPESVEVTADVKDFSLDLTMTVGSADLISKLSDASVDSVDDIHEMLNSLVKATEDLKSGTSQLKSGLGELKNSFVTYADGVKALTKGLVQINDGTSQLNAKTPELTDGIKKVLDGVDTLIEKMDGEDGARAGAAKLAEGASKLDAGIGTLQEKSGALADGVGQLTAGAGEVEKNMQTVCQAFEGTDGQPGLTAGSQAVSDGVAELTQKLTGMVSTIQASIEDNNSKISRCEAGIAQYEAGIGQCDDGLKQCEDGLAACDNGIAQCEAVLQGGISPTTHEVLSEQEIAVYNGKIQELNATKEGLNAKIQEVTGTKEQLIAGKQELADNILKLQGANAALTQILTGMDPQTIMGSLDTLKNGAASVADGVSRTGAGVKQLESEGTAKVAAGLDQLNSQIPALTGGINELKAGSSQLSDGLNRLSGGMDTLSAALKDTLRPGVSKLYDGGLLFKSSIEKLYAGTKQAADGAGQLNSGTDQVSDGIRQLYDGSVKLDDGMGQFKAEAVDRLKDFVDHNLKELTDRAKAMIQAADGYRIYSDVAEGKSSTVKFIYETEAVKPEP